MKKIIYATALVLLSSTAILAEETPKSIDYNEIIAMDGDNEVKLIDLMGFVGNASPEQLQTISTEEWREIASQVLVMKTLAQEFEASPGKDDPLYQAAKENAITQLAALRAIETHVEASMNDEYLQSLYDKLIVEQGPKQEYNAAHILLKTEEEAKDVAAKLKEGGDFAVLAKELSQDTGSAQNGGDLGWFSDGQMLPKFSEAVAALEVGQVSEPIETAAGWHIITLKEVREMPKPPLEDVRAELESNAQNLLSTEYIDNIKNALVIEFADNFDQDIASVFGATPVEGAQNPTLALPDASEAAPAEAVEAVIPEVKSEAAVPAEAPTKKKDHKNNMHQGKHNSSDQGKAQNNSGKHGDLENAPGHSAAAHENAQESRDAGLEKAEDARNKDHIKDCTDFTSVELRETCEKEGLEKAIEALGDVVDVLDSPDAMKALDKVEDAVK